MGSAVPARRTKPEHDEAFDRAVFALLQVPKDAIKDAAAERPKRTRRH
jgi:hypothetical protein